MKTNEFISFTIMIIKRKLQQIHERPVHRGKISNRWRLRLIQEKKKKTLTHSQFVVVYYYYHGVRLDPTRIRRRIKSASLKHLWKFPQTGRRLVTDTTNRAITAARR